MFALRKNSLEPRARLDVEFADALVLIAEASGDRAVRALRNVGRAVADDVDDAAHAVAAVFRRNRAGQHLDRVDDLRVDDLGEVRGRRQRQRRAVDVVGHAVEAVDDRLVVRELHDAGQRLEQPVEAVIDRRRSGSYVRVELIDRRRIGLRARRERLRSSGRSP